MSFEEDKAEENRKIMQEWEDEYVNAYLAGNPITYIEKKNGVEYKYTTSYKNVLLKNQRS